MHDNDLFEDNPKGGGDVYYGATFIRKQKFHFDSRLMQLTDDLKKGIFKSSKLNPEHTMHPISDLFSQRLGMNVPALRGAWRQFETICQKNKSLHYKGDLFKRQLRPDLMIILSDLIELSKKITTNLYEQRTEAMNEDNAFLSGRNLNEEDEKLFKSLNITPQLRLQIEALSRQVGLRKSREKIVLPASEARLLASIHEKIKTLTVEQASVEKHLKFGPSSA